MKHALQITLYCFSCQDFGRFLNYLATDIGSDSSFLLKNNWVFLGFVGFLYILFRGHQRPPDNKWQWLRKQEDAISHAALEPGALRVQTTSTSSQHSWEYLGNLCITFTTRMFSQSLCARRPKYRIDLYSNMESAVVGGFESLWLRGTTAEQQLHFFCFQLSCFHRLRQHPLSVSVLLLIRLSPSPHPCLSPCP